MILKDTAIPMISTVEISLILILAFSGIEKITYVNYYEKSGLDTYFSLKYNRKTVTGVGMFFTRNITKECHDRCR